MRQLSYRFASGLCLLICFVLVTSACTTIRVKRQQPACQELFSRIKTEWARDPASGLYRFQHNPQGSLGHEIIAHPNCLIGLRQRDIARLFQQPDTMYRGHMAYYLQTPCLEAGGVEANGCGYLRFTFGQERRVTGVHVVTNGFKH
jgi:hypothetical protein